MFFSGDYSTKPIPYSPDSYCIPLRMICDGTSDCADGEDEEGCDAFVCRGALRCRHDNICIHPIDICDGVVHCLMSEDDESLCHMLECPKACVCRGDVLMCDEHLPNPGTVSLHIRTLIYTNIFFSSMYAFGMFVDLLHISVCHSQLQSNILKKDMLAKLFQTQSLDFRNDSIQFIESNTFAGMSNLLYLDVSGNIIRLVPEFTLHGLKSLGSLDLSTLHIETLQGSPFKGLAELTHLNLSYNLLTTLHIEAFMSIKDVRMIDLRHNNIHHLDRHTFAMLSAWVVIHVSIPVYCCYLYGEMTCVVNGRIERNRLQCFDMTRDFTSVAHIVLSLLLMILTFLCIMCIQYSKHYESHITLLQNLSCFYCLPAVSILCFNINAFVFREQYIFLDSKRVTSFPCLLLNLLVSTGYLLSKLTTFLMVLN